MIESQKIEVRVNPETTNEQLARLTRQVVSNWSQGLKRDDQTDYPSLVGDLQAVHAIHKANLDLVDWDTFAAMAYRPDIGPKFPEVASQVIQKLPASNQMPTALGLFGMGQELSFGTDPIEKVIGELLTNKGEDHTSGFVKKFWRQIEQARTQGNTNSVEDFLALGRRVGYLTEQDYIHYRNSYIDKQVRTSESSIDSTSSEVNLWTKLPDIHQPHPELGVILHATTAGPLDGKLSNWTLGNLTTVAMVYGRNHFLGIAVAIDVANFLKQTPDPTPDQLKQAIERTRKGPETGLIKVVNEGGIRAALVARTNRSRLCLINSQGQIVDVPEPECQETDPTSTPVRNIIQKVILHEGDQLILASESIPASLLNLFPRQLQNSKTQDSGLTLKRFIDQQGHESYGLLVVDTKSAPTLEIALVGNPTKSYPILASQPVNEADLEDFKQQATDQIRQAELVATEVETVEPEVVLAHKSLQVESATEIAQAENELKVLLTAIEQSLEKFKSLVKTVTPNSHGLDYQAAMVLNSKFARIAKNRPDEYSALRQALEINAGRAVFHHTTFARYGFQNSQQSMVENLVDVVTQIAMLAPDSEELLAFPQLLAHTPGTQSAVEKYIDEDPRLKTKKEQLEKILNYNQPLNEEMITPESQPDPQSVQ